jgi:hypothetical protein
VRTTFDLSDILARDSEPDRQLSTEEERPGKRKGPFEGNALGNDGRASPQDRCECEAVESGWSAASSATGVVCGCADDAGVTFLVGERIWGERREAHRE